MSDTWAGVIFVWHADRRAGAGAQAARRLHGAGADRHAAPRASSAASTALGGVDAGRRPDVGPLPALGARVQRRVGAVPLRVPARAAALLAAVRGAADDGRPVVQHRGQLRHEHQLAVVLGRERARLRRADGRPGGAELRLGRGGHRGRDRAGARLRPQPDRPARQLLGRPDPDLPAHPAADLDRVRDRVRRRRHDRRTSTTTRRSTRSPAARRRSPAARSPARRSSRSSARTAAASTTPTPRTRSRTRRRGRTGSRSSCCCASRSRCRARSAGWSATSGRATRSSRSWRCSRSVSVGADASVFQGMHHGTVPTAVGAATEGTETRFGVPDSAIVRHRHDADLDRRGGQLPRLLHQPRRRARCC